MNNEAKKRKKEINRVRQVLMNELGLTREYIREEMQILIREEARNVVAEAFGEMDVRRIITNDVLRALRTQQHYIGKKFKTIEEEVIDGIRNQVKEYLDENFKINIQMNDQSDN